MVCEPLQVGLRRPALNVIEMYLWRVDIQEQAVLVHAGHTVYGLSEHIGGLEA